MTPPAAILQFTAAGEVALSIAGEGPIRFLVIDERTPGDRLFEVTTRLTPEEFAALVPPDAEIGSNDDARHPALLARLHASETGERHLRSVE